MLLILDLFKAAKTLYLTHHTRISERHSRQLHVDWYEVYRNKNDFIQAFFYWKAACVKLWWVLRCKHVLHCIAKGLSVAVYVLWLHTRMHPPTHKHTQQLEILYHLFYIPISTKVMFSHAHTITQMHKYTQTCFLTMILLSSYKEISQLN